MENVFNLQSFPPVLERVQSFNSWHKYICNKWKSWRRLQDHCGLSSYQEAIMKDQVREQLNKIRVAATATDIDEEMIENRKVRDCV